MEEAPVPDSLQRQNQELRRRLDEDSANYRRRLETYRQAQKHQATLVSRLQAKVSNIARDKSFFMWAIIKCSLKMYTEIYYAMV